MSRATITVTIDHHPATAGLDRVKQLLEFAADEYGVRSLTYEVEEES